MHKENVKNMHAFKNLAKICKYMHIETETVDELMSLQELNQCQR